MTTQNKPEIHIVMENSEPVTTSKNVAEIFDKKHKHILEAVDELKGVAENSADLFREDFYTHSQNKQRYRMYYMTKDGFTLLTMGFTGKKAVKFKMAYIKRFNEMEHQLQKQLPGTYKEALMQLVEQEEEKEQLELENTQMKPKADYFDKYIKNEGVMTIGVIAENYGISARAMNKLLHDLGVQYKQGKTWRLYAKYKNEGFAHMEGFDYTDSNGNLKINPTLKWHPKGHHFIYETLKDNGILPMIEQEETNELSIRPN